MYHRNFVSFNNQLNQCHEKGIKKEKGIKEECTTMVDVPNLSKQSTQNQMESGRGIAFTFLTSTINQER